MFSAGRSSQARCAAIDAATAGSEARPQTVKFLDAGCLGGIVSAGPARADAHRVASRLLVPTLVRTGRPGPRRLAPQGLTQAKLAMLACTPWVPGKSLRNGSKAAASGPHQPSLRPSPPGQAGAPIQPGRRVPWRGLMPRTGTRLAGFGWGRRRGPCHRPMAKTVMDLQGRSARLTGQTAANTFYRQKRPSNAVDLAGFFSMIRLRLHGPWPHAESLQSSRDWPILCKGTFHDPSSVSRPWRRLGRTRNALFWLLLAFRSAKS